MQKLGWFIKLLFGTFSIFLVTQKVIMGVNLSFADLLLLPVCVALIYSERFSLPPKVVVTFLFFSVWTLCVSIIISCGINGYALDLDAVLIDYLKLFVCFLYLCIGICFAKYNIWKFFLKKYAGTSVVVSLLGIFLTISMKMGFINSESFYTGNRYQGFTDDPNLFAIMQLVGLSYYLFSENINERFRLIGITIISCGVVLSGSKTGIIVLIFLLFGKNFSIAFNMNSNFKVSVKKMRNKLVLICILVVMCFTAFYMEDVIREIVPASNRIFYLFENFEQGMTNDGSSRENVWLNSLEVINQNMIFGTGVGAYLPVSEYLTGQRVLAHNTYLQILAEWGLPLGATFFIYIFISTRRYFLGKGNKDAYLIPIIMVLFSGSLSLSLNNNRIFWLVIGALLAFSEKKKWKKV